MRDAGVAATVITYNSLINCYARARDAAGAERVLVTMREEAGVRRRDRGAKMPAVLFTVYNVVCGVLCVVRRALCGSVHYVCCSRVPIRVFLSFFLSFSSSPSSPGTADPCDVQQSPERVRQEAGRSRGAARRPADERCGY